MPAKTANPTSSAADASNGTPVQSPNLPQKLLLVDGHSLAYRAYYAFALSREGGLRTSTGIPTSVSYGFTKSLLDILAREDFNHVAIAFDTPQPTFRHEADESYKAGRPETPEEFIIDIQNLQELLAAMKLPILKAPGFEADDIIGTLATTAPVGLSVRILSGDRDLFQLVSDERDVKVMYMGGSYSKRSGNGGVREMGDAEVVDKLGVRPDQVVDFKALCGDKSDNIPGVRGIGEKTAVKLLSQYETLDRVYASIDELKGAVKKKLETGKEAANHSQFMAQIKVDVPLGVAFEQLKLDGFDRDRVEEQLTTLELQSFLRQIDKIHARLSGSSAEAVANETVANEAVATVTSASQGREQHCPRGRLVLFGGGYGQTSGSEGTDTPADDCGYG